MKDLKKFIKSSGVYLIGNVLVKALSFFMLPLYTRYLSPNDYGTYDLSLAYITFLSSILFLDIWGGIMRFMFDYKTDEEKEKPVIVGMVIFTISTLIYTLAIVLLKNIIDIPFPFLLFLYGLLTNLNQVIGFTARAKGNNYAYTIGGVIGSVVTIIFNIVFIAGFKLGFEYLYIAYCMGMIVNIIILNRSISFFKKLKLKSFNKFLFKEMLIYAAPLSINSAAFWFLSSYNRVVISNELTTVENGLYAVANKFSIIIQLFTQGFQMAWQELTFSKATATKQEMDKFYTLAVNEYIKFLSLATIILIPIIKIIFPLMIDSSYESAVNIIPFALVATLFSAISSFLASIISTIKKNRFIFTTTLFGSVVNVILINVLINPIGVQAASISLAFGYLAIVIRRFILINRYIKIKLDYFTILCLVVWGGISCYYFIFFNNLANGILLLISCCLSIIFYRKKIKLFISKVSSKKEK